MEKTKNRIAKKLSSLKPKVAAVIKKAVAPVSKAVAPKKRVSEDEIFRLIQAKAYEVYVKRGCNHGKDLENWYEAERLVREELGLK